MRGYDLAKNLHVDSAEVLRVAETLGITGRKASSNFDDEEAGKIRRQFLEEKGVDVASGADLSPSRASYAAQLSERWEVSISTDAIGDALRQTDRLPSETLTSEERDVVVRELVELGDLPSEALADIELPASLPSRKRPGSALIRVPEGDTRERTVTDNDTLEWLTAVIEASQAIANARGIFVPEFFEARSGDGVVYKDPLSKFLEPSEFGRIVGPNGSEGVNWIYAAAEYLIEWREQGTSFGWRSNELLSKFRRRLFSLWCAHQYCRGCHRQLTDEILRDDVKMLLRTEQILPGVEHPKGGKKKRTYRFPEFHPWCKDIRHARVRMEVALQYSDLVGAELDAERSGKLVELAGEVALKNAAYGVDRATVIRAFRDNIRVSHEGRD